MDIYLEGYYTVFTQHFVTLTFLRLETLFEKLSLQSIKYKNILICRGPKEFLLLNYTTTQIPILNSQLLWIGWCSLNPLVYATLTDVLFLKKKAPITIKPVHFSRTQFGRDSTVEFLPP